MVAMKETNGAKKERARWWNLMEGLVKEVTFNGH